MKKERSVKLNFEASGDNCDSANELDKKKRSNTADDAYPATRSIPQVVAVLKDNGNCILGCKSVDSENGKIVKRRLHSKSSK